MRPHYIFLTGAQQAGMVMHLSQIHQIGANAGDFQQTRRFYEEVLGAHFVAEFDPPGLLFFDFSGIRVLFERNNTQAMLYFWVDDIDEAYASLVEKGVRFDGEPHLIHKDVDGTFGKSGSEEWMAFFKDPGGNTLVLATRR